MSRRHRSRRKTEPLPLTVASAALLVALVAIPAFFNIQTAVSFEPDKGALLRTFAAIALIGLLLADGRRLWSGARDIWSGLSLPFKLLAVLALAWGLSTLLGVDPVTGFWGNHERGYGLLSLLSGGAIVIVAYQMARAGQTWLLIDAILLASAVPALYGLLQVIGYDPVIGQSVSFELGQRASSSLGNPLFLANFLLLAIPLGLARLLVGPRLKGGSKAGLIAYLTLLVLVLFATYSRTALGAALAALAILFVALGRRERRRALMGLGLLVLGAGFALLLVALIAPGVLPSGLRDIFASGGTGGQRLLFWQALLDLLRSEPRWLLTGVGPDALPLKLAPYLSPEIAHFEVDWAFRIPDRAHALAFDLLASWGTLGLLVWTLFWAAVVTIILPAFPRRPYLPFLLQLAGALVFAVLAAALVGPTAIALGITVGLLGGVLFALLIAPASGPGAATLHARIAPYLLAALVGDWLFLTFSFPTHAPSLLFWVIVGLALAGGAVTEAGAGQDVRDRRSPHLFLAGVAFATFGFSLSAAFPLSIWLWLGSLALLIPLAYVLMVGKARQETPWYDLFIPALSLIPAILLNRYAGLPAWGAYAWLLLWLLAMIWLLLPVARRRAAWPALAVAIPLVLLLNLPIFGDIAYKSAIFNIYDTRLRAALMERAFLLSPYDHVLANGIALVESQLLPEDVDFADPRAQGIVGLYEHAMKAQPLAPEPVAAYAEWLRQRTAANPDVATLAADTFDRALAMSPNDIQTRNRLALFRWQQGETEQAIDDLEALLLVDPLYGPTYLNLAQIQAGQGEIEAARATLTAGIANVPWWDELPRALARLR